MKLNTAEWLMVAGVYLILPAILLFILLREWEVGSNSKQ